MAMKEVGGGRYSEDAVKIDWVSVEVSDGRWGCPSDEDTGWRRRKFGNNPHWVTVKTGRGRRW